MPIVSAYKSVDQLRTIMALCQEAREAGLIAIAISQVEEIASPALRTPDIDPTSAEGRAITNSEHERDFVAPVWDVMMRMDLSRRQQARFIAQMYEEHYQAARTGIVQACADVARGWDAIEAALAGSAVAQDIADGILHKMLDRASEKA